MQLLETVGLSGFDLDEAMRTMAGFSCSEISDFIVECLAAEYDWDYDWPPSLDLRKLYNAINGVLIA